MALTRVPFVLMSISATSLDPDLKLRVVTGNDLIGDHEPLTERDAGAFPIDEKLRHTRLSASMVPVELKQTWRVSGAMSWAPRLRASS